MATITQDHIDSVTPSTLAAWLKACSAKGILVDTFNPLLAHVPASQLQSKAEGNDGAYIAPHEFALDALDISLDTILRLSTIIMLKHKRVSPTGKDKELHLAAVGLESLELINNDAELDADGDNSTRKGKTIMASDEDLLACGITNFSNIAIDENGNRMATWQKHQTHGLGIQIIFIYGKDNKTFTAKVEHVLGAKRMATSNDNAGRLLIWANPNRVIDDTFDI